MKVRVRAMPLRALFHSGICWSFIMGQWIAKKSALRCIVDVPGGWQAEEQESELEVSGGETTDCSPEYSIHNGDLCGRQIEGEAASRGKQFVKKNCFRASLVHF